MRAQRDYVWNANGITADIELSTTDLVVFNKLLVHADSAGKTYVRAKRIAKDTLLSERTVRGSISKLRQAHVLSVSTVATRTGRANVYELHATPVPAKKATTSRTPPAENNEAPSGSATEAPPLELIPVPSTADTPQEPPPESVQASVPEVVATVVPAEGSGGSCNHSTTGAAPAAGPPVPYPSSERININDPPLSPPEGGAREVVEPQDGEDENEAIVARVLDAFRLTLWPNSVGPSVDRVRRRVVLGRLRELQRGHVESPEQVLLDTVLGAKHHPWHRESEHRRHARIIFRDLDKVEELARLGRTRRLAERRDPTRREGEPPSSPHPAHAPTAPERLEKLTVPLDAPQWLKDIVDSPCPPRRATPPPRSSEQGLAKAG